MRDRRNCHARSIRAPGQLLKTLQNLCLVFNRNGCSTFWILVEDSHEVRAVKFAVHAGMIAPKFSRADNGDTDLLRFSRRRTHSLLVPFKAPLGSAMAGGGQA